MLQRVPYLIKYPLILGFCGAIIGATLLGLFFKDSYSTEFPQEFIVGGAIVSGAFGGGIIAGVIGFIIGLILTLARKR
jgi:hypothetical protein